MHPMVTIGLVMGLAAMYCWERSVYISNIGRNWREVYQKRYILSEQRYFNRISLVTMNWIITQFAMLSIHYGAQLIAKSVYESNKGIHVLVPTTVLCYVIVSGFIFFSTTYLRWYTTVKAAIAYLDPPMITRMDRFVYKSLYLSFIPAVVFGYHLSTLVSHLHLLHLTTATMVPFLYAARTSE